MQKLSRICIVLSVVCLIVACCVAPASATEYDFYDYITNITVDGDHDYVEVTLPYVGYTAYYNGETNNLITGFWGNPFGRDLYKGWIYDLICTPLGKQHNLNPGIGYLYNGGFLNIDDLPPDAQVSTYAVLKSDVGTLSIGSGSLIYYYMGNELVDDSVKLDKITNNSGNEVVDGGSTIILQDTFSGFGDYKYFWPVIYIPNLYVSTTSFVTFDASVKLSFKVSSAYMDYVETGKNQALLKAVDAQLKSQGQTLSGVLNQQAQTNEKLQDVLEQQQQTNNKLDGVIDKQEQTNDKLDDVVDQQDQTNEKLDNITGYEPTPESPSGSDSFDDLEDIETDLREDASSALDEFLELNDITHEGLEPYLTSLFAVSYIFEMFADLPFFSVLLGVSLCLGLTGTILGISNTLIRSTGKGKD